METLILSTSSIDIAKAAEILHQHQPVAFPTETVYGLGANLVDELAIRRIFELKGRPTDNPLIAHIADLSQVEELAHDIPDVFYPLAKAFFPGPLTVVLPRNQVVPASVSAHLPSIALRMPDHPVALQLIEAVGQPLVAPSANLSGKPSPTTAQHVLEDLNGKVAAVIDGGSTTLGIESTVIDLTQPIPVILRPGSITAAELSDVIGISVSISAGQIDEHQVVASPGMKYQHYAPHARVRVYQDWQTCLLAIGSGFDQSLILTNVMESAPSSVTDALAIRPLTAPSLFAQFRAADHLGAKQIIIVLDPKTQSHQGLMNRILKAAA